MGNGSLTKKDTKVIAKKSKILYVFIGLFFILSYLLISFYYNTRFLKNTVINGVDTSNMTIEQAEEAIQKQFKTYLLELEGRNSLTGQIYGKDFDIHAEFDGSLGDLLDSQNSFKWLGAFFKTTDLNIATMPRYDEDLLKDLVSDLPYFQEKNIIRPASAYISGYEKDKGYEIVSEVLGAQADFDILFPAIKEAVFSLEPTVSLEEIDCYVKPKITSEFPGIVQAAMELNKMASTELIYEFGEDIEVLDGTQISQWLSYSDDWKVTLDEEGVKEYVDYIGKTYNTFGKTRTFRTSYGKEIKVKGGDYGWWLNRPAEVSELMELIIAGEQGKKEPAYHQKAQQYGEDDIGDTYVEVNLTAQHLFFYKEGKLILDTDFVSGNLSKNYGTPTGTFGIQYKERNATLRGEDYTTPVDYWMPFYRGVGFHDASWRKEFGKNIYKTRGSHGCINMPPRIAKIMYENISPGVAVIVY